MDRGADADADENPDPDLADDLAHLFDADLQPVHERQPFLGQIADGTRIQVAHPVLQVALQPHAAHDEPRHRGDAESEDEIDRGDLPADQAIEQTEAHRPHHRPRDQERERHAERDACRDKADEERHR